MCIWVMRRIRFPVITAVIPLTAAPPRKSKLNTVKPAMVEEATKNAREEAQKFAADSGSHIGKIKSANQGQFSITDANQSTPYEKKVRVVTTVTYFLKD